MRKINWRALAADARRNPMDLLAVIGWLALIATIWSVIAGLAIGWGINIYKIITTCCAVIDGMLVARIIGVFIGPLGGVLGWF